MRGLLLVLAVVFILAGCAPPVTYVVDVAYAPGLKGDVAAKPEKPQIAIVPLEDRRPDKSIIGTRKRIFGRVDKFDARPAPVTAAVTQALVSSLKIHGYKAEILPRGANPESITQSPPNIVVSGRIENLFAEARSKIGYTDIKTNIRLQLKIFRVDEKSSYTINVQSQSEPRVVSFNPSVMQKVINETITDAMDRLIESQWNNR